MTGKYLVIFILILAPMMQIPAFASKGKDYSEELERLDEILSKKEIYVQYLKDRIYVQYLKDRINILKSVLDEQDDLSQIYGINMRIAGEFRSYSLDSTMAYLGKCRSIALQLEDSVKLIETDIATAEEYTLGGYHLEAQAILHRLESEQIPQSLRYQYLKARHNLAGELMAYANDNRIFKEQDSLRTVYRNALLAMAGPGTFDWYMLKMEEAVQYGRLQEAKECAEKLVDVSEEGSHEYAIACYHYQDMLGENAPLEEKMLWLIRSAYTDVMCATKDYASLNFLASDLFSCGDIDRAFSYTAAHCMPDAIFFGGKLRPWQIAMFFPGQGLSGQEYTLAAVDECNGDGHGRPYYGNGGAACFHLHEAEGSGQDQKGPADLVSCHRAQEPGSYRSQQEAFRPECQDTGVGQDKTGVYHTVPEHTLGKHQHHQTIQEPCPEIYPPRQCCRYRCGDRGPAADR